MRQRLSALSPLISWAIGASSSISPVRLPWIADLIWSTRSPSWELDESVTPAGQRHRGDVRPLATERAVEQPHALRRAEAADADDDVQLQRHPLGVELLQRRRAALRAPSGLQTRFDPIRTGAR